MKTSRKQGFTMIELLVVIVIIGILAGALIPGVTSFMLTGKLTGMMGNGRKVVQAIIAADMSGRYEGIAWPAAENVNMKDSDDSSTGPDMYQDFSKTSDYFTQALYMEQTDVKKRNRLKVLQDIEAKDIAGEGITTASSTKIDDKNCAWILAKNVGDAPNSAPVFVTRNVNTSTLVGLAGNDTSTDSETLLTSVKPFQQDGCVMIYKDGSGQKYKANEVFAKKILSGLGSGKLSDFKQSDSAFEFMSSGSSK